MNINVGKNIRVSDFIDSRDNRSVLLDLTASSSVGAGPGTEDIGEVLRQFNASFDGLILNPGQLEHHAALIGGKMRAAPLVRVDWTNAYRNKEFCLPATVVTRVPISDAEDALRLGASAAVATFLLGFGEDMEAENVRSISLLARECYRLSLPLIVDIRPIGDKVTDDNYQGAIKLGTSFMMEAGADALILPDCDNETCALLGKWVTIPVLLRLDEIPTTERMEALLGKGLMGVVLTERFVATQDEDRKSLNPKELIHRL